MRVLAALVLLAGCYRGEATAPEPRAPVSQPRHARTASDPLGFLPMDSELVVHLDAQQLRKSSLWARFEPTVMAKVGSTLEQFRVLCGFDPVPVIHRIAVGVKGLSTPEVSGVLVVRGITREQLMPCIDRSLAQQPQLGSIDRGIVTLTGEQPVVFTFADARTLVMLGGHGASKRALGLALDAGAPLRASEAFMEMFARIDTKRAAWLFMNGTSKFFDRAASFGVKPRAFFGSIDVSGGLAAKLFLRLNNPSEAQSLVAMLQQQATAVQPLVEKIELVAEDADAVMDLSLTEDQATIFAGLVGP